MVADRDRWRNVAVRAGEDVERFAEQLEGVVDLLREARELLPHAAFAGWRHDERHSLIGRIDAALGGR